jgi:hypothetical protein
MTMRVVTSAVYGFCSRVIVTACALRGADGEKNTAAAHAAISNWFFAAFGALNPAGKFGFYCQLNPIAERKKIELNFLSYRPPTFGARGIEYDALRAAFGEGETHRQQ